MTYRALFVEVDMAKIDRDEANERRWARERLVWSHPGARFTVNALGCIVPVMIVEMETK